MSATLVEREAAAAALLAENGIAGARVTSAGQEQEIAAIRVDIRYFARLQHLSAELKSLGYRYIAIDIGDME